VAYLFLTGYLALIYIRPGEILPALAGLPIVMIYSLIALAVVVVTQLHRPWTLFDIPHDWALLCLSVAVVVSNLAWGWFDGAYRAAITFLPAIFTYFLIRLAVTTPGQLRRIVRLVIVLSLFQAANGIVQFHTGTGLGGVTTIEHSGDSVEEDPRIRGTGIFQDPNDLAMALLIAVPFLLTDLFSRTGSAARRALSASALVPIVLAILYTGSRGGMLGFVMILVLFSARRYGRLAGATVAILAIVLTTALGSATRIAEMDSREESAQGRVQAWSVGLGLFKTHPIFGVGFGRFTEFHERVAHNSFVHVLAELGLAGILPAVAAVYWFFKGLRPQSTAPDSAKRDASLGRDLVLVGAGFFASALFLSRQYVPITYLVLGLGASQAALARPTVRSTSRDAAWIAVLTAAGIFGIYVAVRVLAVWGRP
jgi:hypothetical protein